MQDEYKDGDTFMENGILVERKYVDLSDELQHQHQKKPKWVPNNVAEYFFFDEFGFLSINEKKILECYSEFTETMRLIYNNMRAYYNKFSQRVVNEEDLNIMDFPRVIKELELNGLEYYLEKEKLEIIQTEAKIKKAQQIVQEADEDDSEAL